MTEQQAKEMLELLQRILDRLQLIHDAVKRKQGAY